MANFRQRQPLETRIEKSLRRQGYPQASITHRGDGKIEVGISGTSRDDECLIKATVQTVAGVTAVVITRQAGNAAPQPLPSKAVPPKAALA